MKETYQRKLNLQQTQTNEEGSYIFYCFNDVCNQCFLKGRWLVLCQNITIYSKPCLLKLSNRETGATSLYLFSSPYCWVWIHICSNSAVRMYWMSVCPCLVLALSKYVLLKYQLLKFFVSSLLCFMHQLMLSFCDFYTRQYAFFLGGLHKKKLL